MKKKSISKKREKFLKRSVRVFSRHPSHNKLRNKIFYPTLCLIRFGSQTKGKVKYDVELNSPESVRNSANKLLMKQCFTKADVKTADWWTTKNGELFLTPNLNRDNCQSAELPYPIVAKHIFGSRGTGNTLINNKEELQKWIPGKNLSNYIFEKFYNYNKEYRLHVSASGCFYACRKMLKSDTPENNRWYRNDNNSVWILENNELFDKPVNWEEIIEHSVKALKAVGLDVGAIDLRIQSSKDSKNKLRNKCDFIVIEINSAPSFGDITFQKYMENIPKIIDYKKQNLK